MAWTSPRTWTACEIVTATLLNTHVRDNLLETAPAKVTTKGDLVVATGANALARVGVAASGVLIPNTACNAGVVWDTTLRVISGSRINLQGVGSSTEETVAIQFLSGTAGASSLPAYGIGAGPTNSQGFMSYRSGTCNTQVFGHKWYINDLHVGRVTGNGQWIIGSSATACNTFMGIGLTVSGAGGEAVSVKYDTVAHGMTDDADTDTAFTIVPGLSGGARLWGFRGTGALGIAAGVAVTGAITSASSDRHRTAAGAVAIEGQKKSGTTASDMAANENILVVRSGTSGSVTRFIFDSDGDLHADAAVTASAYDTFDDAQLIRTLEVERGGAGVVRGEFDNWLRYNRQHLEAAKIATFNDGPGGDGSIFVNYTGLARLQSGAIWQLYTANQRLVAEVRLLQSQLSERTGSQFGMLGVAEAPA